jgi:NAD+ synthase (glutamine-hydrolysing)
MNNIKVGVAALNQTPLDWKNNTENIITAIERAKFNNVKLLALPELCVTGYGCEDAFYAKHIQETAFKQVLNILDYTKDIAVCVGLPFCVSGNLYNTVAFLVDGAIAGLVPKKALARDGVHYENRWFKQWNTKEKYTTDAEIPFGDLVFDLGGLKVGFEICEESWIPNRTGHDLCSRGVDIIINPSASHFSFGKQETRRRFVIDGSRAFSCAYLYSNLLGNEAGRIIYDGSCFVANCGKLIEENERFSYDTVDLISANISLDEMENERVQHSGFEIDHDYSGKTTVVLDNDFTNEDKIDTPCTNITDMDKYKEFEEATCLGLFDYLRKSKSKGYIVSLSGGADSSIVTCLVELMCSKVHENSPFLISELGIKDKLLTCVYQRTKNSSEITYRAAKELAESLNDNVEFITLDVDEIFDNYVKMIGKSIDRDIMWETDDLALQNIQARVRSPGVWMLANLKNKLLLTTSNRSESAVGYCTMDGDTSGCLNPIGGIDKAFIRDWLKWAEKEYDCFYSLKYVNEQTPTAELRPAECHQTDEADLMPYEVLNRIEDLAIRLRYSPKDICKILETEYNKESVKKWVEKFFKLFCRNQWKRERFAISFHLDDRNLDPKSWCRFPVLSGGFEEELKNL